MPRKRSRGSIPLGARSRPGAGIHRRRRRFGRRASRDRSIRRTDWAVADRDVAGHRDRSRRDRRAPPPALRDTGPRRRRDHGVADVFGPRHVARRIPRRQDGGVHVRPRRRVADLAQANRGRRRAALTTGSDDYPGSHPTVRPSSSDEHDGRRPGALSRLVARRRSAQVDRQRRRRRLVAGRTRAGVHALGVRRPIGIGRRHRVGRRQRSTRDRVRVGARAHHAAMVAGSPDDCRGQRAGQRGCRHRDAISSMSADPGRDSSRRPASA